MYISNRQELQDTQAVIRPHVLNFIEVATSTSSMELAIEEFPVPEKSPMAGMSLIQAKVRDRFGIIIIGSRSLNQDMIFNPPADYTIQVGDMLIAMGKRENLSAFRGTLLS